MRTYLWPSWDETCGGKCGETESRSSELVDIASEKVGGGVALPISRSGRPPVVPVTI